MAGDRYGWLDADGAERLLRGEPLARTALSPADEQGARPALSARDRAAAERLTALLAATAAVGRPAADEELPGEQAAMAAFRAVRDAHRPPPQPVAVGPLIRLAPGDRGRGHRTIRRLRTLRAAVTVAAVSCVLGGVALAVGTGVRPGSLTPQAPPDTGPATASATTGEDGTGEAGKGKDGKDGKGEAGSGKGSAPAQESKLPGGGPGDTGRGNGNGDLPGRSPEGQGKNHSRGKDLDKLCRQLAAAQHGKGAMPDQNSWHRLARAAGGEEAIAAYCGHGSERPSQGRGQDKHAPGGQQDQSPGNSDDRPGRKHPQRK